MTISVEPQKDAFGETLNIKGRSPEEERRGGHGFWELAADKMAEVPQCNEMGK